MSSDDEQRDSARTARALAAAAITVVPPVVVSWTAAAWSDRLPDPLPTHWSELSTPDGFTSYAGTWQTLLVVASIGAALGLAGAVLARLKPLYQRATTAIGAAAGFGALGIWLATALAAWGRTDAHEAPLGWGVALPAVLGIVGAALVLLVIGRRPRTAPTVQPSAAPSSGLTLAPGERAVWVDRRFVVWPLVIAAVLAVAAVVMALTASTLAATVMAASVLVAGMLAWVQVTVDDRGLRIGLGPWAWTVKKVPLAAIASATAQQIDPVDWGGWGYRVLPGRSALVLGAGPAIVLELTDGRRFAVTVEHPEPAVALLDALRVRAT